MALILTDVTVLVYAFREGAPEHQAYADWLADATVEHDLLLPDAVLTGFLRVVTNARIMDPPAATADALSFVSALRGAERHRRIDGTAAVWAAFTTLCRDDPGVRGNLVPDAYLAAVALSHSDRLATRDRGFARFPGVRWFDPRDES